MQINATIDIDLKKDDDKFLLAVSDESKREERLQQLSNLRRMFCKVAIIQIFLFVATLSIDLFLTPISQGQVKSLGFLTVVMGGAGLFYMVFFLYLDIQVKFLKAVSSS